jgi:hypothetical protein
MRLLTVQKQSMISSGTECINEFRLHDRRVIFSSTPEDGHRRQLSGDNDGEMSLWQNFTLGKPRLASNSQKIQID